MHSRPESIINFFISIGLAFIVGFLLTFILSKSVKMNTSVEKEGNIKESMLE